jgi:hypothetical protein
MPLLLRVDAERMEGYWSVAAAARDLSGMGGGWSAVVKQGDRQEEGAASGMNG